MLEKLKKSEFSKNVLTLITGSSIAQLIPFAAEPILSRIFTPAEFGIFEIYAAIVIMTGSVATARYEMAIILPRLENKAVNILGLSVFIVVAFSLFCLVVLLLTENYILGLINHIEFGKYLFYIPLGVFLVGINRSFLYWSLRQKYMKTISFSRITESAGKAGSSILFGFLRFSSFGLILGQIIGQAASAVILIYRFFATDRIKVRFFSLKNFARQAKEHAEFPKINLPLTISEMLQISGLIFVFALFVDTSTLGEISKAIRILLIPLTLIATSIAQVFYQKASQEFAKGIDISKSLKKIVSSLFLWSLPGFILFLFISPWLFGFVLGKEWTTAGEYARILSFWIFLKFIVSPVTIIPLIINKQRAYFILNLIGNIIMIGSIILPRIFQMEIYHTLMILSISQVLFLLFLYLKVMSMYTKNLKTL